MSSISAFLDGELVLATGTIVGRKGNVVSIFPLEKNPLYCVTFKHSLAGPGQFHQTNAYLSGPNAVVVELIQSRAASDNVTVVDTVFSSDSEFYYLLNYYMSIFGSDDDYSFVFGYTVRKRSV